MVRWLYLSSNKNAIDLLEQHQDKIDWWHKTFDERLQLYFSHKNFFLYLKFLSYRDS